MSAKEEFQARRKQCRYSGTVYTLLMFLFIAGIAIAKAEPYDLQSCSFLGGNKWERVQSVFVDARGFIYAVGSTKSADFPTTPGAYDRTGSGNNSNDGFVAKIAPDGKSLIWSTYLHGTDRDDVYGVHVDTNGYVYAVGWTGSSDFPTTPGAYDRTQNGDKDVFITKLQPDGSSLVYSTFFGGSRVDQCRGSMDFDAQGNIYLSGYTNSLDFPTTDGAIQRTFKGGYGDAFMAKLSADGSSLLFSTYLGSTGPDHAFPGIRLHSDGSIIVTGVAGAADFPTTPGAYQPVFAGTEVGGVWYGDVFVARFSLTPTHEHVLHYITFLGGSGMEKSTAQHGLVLDKDGNAVIAVTTHSTDFPTTANAYQKILKGKNNVCISKLSLDGSQLLGSTYFGGSSDNGYEPSGLCLDRRGNVLISGSIFGNVTDHPTTSDAFQRTSGGQNESFFAVLSPDLSNLRYSSHFGGSGHDRIRDMVRSSSGELVFAGDSYSTNLPVTDSAFQTNYRGAGDAYVAGFKPTRLSAGNVHDYDSDEQMSRPRTSFDEQWELVWNDEFNYEGLADESKWSYESGFVRNREKQYYTKARAENARVEDGTLIIESRRERYEGGDYTSASLHTWHKAEWLYGRIEVRAKLPTGKGMWPAIWMLGTNRRQVGWPACGEIDIMENVGFDPGVIHANIHTKAYNHMKGTNKGAKIKDKKPYEQYHVYAIEWFEDRIDFYFDDEKYFSFENEGTGNDVWPFDKPHYLILNAAIGGSWGGQKGIDDTIFPQKYYIDYVRVFKQKAD